MSRPDDVVLSQESRVEAPITAGESISLKYEPKADGDNGKGPVDLRDYGIAEKLAEEHLIIAEIGRVIGSTLNIDEVYERFAIEAKKLIPFDRISVSMIAPDKKHRVVAYVSGLDISRRRPGELVPLAGSSSEAVVQARRGLIVQSMSGEELIARFPALEASALAGIRSQIGIPLISRNEVIGSLVFQSKTPLVYTERDLLLAERIGAQIAGAMANVQLFNNLSQAEKSLRKSEEEQRRLAQENAIIAEIGRVIGSTLDIEEVYGRFAVEAKKLISFDRIVVNRVNPEEGTRLVAYISGVKVPGSKQGLVLPLKGSMTEAVTQTRLGMIVQSSRGEELISRFPSLEASVQAGILSHISMPMISRNEVIGNLVFQCRKPEFYTGRDLLLAERIGAQIAGAMANAQFYAVIKKTETDLRESEAHYRSLFENMLEGFAYCKMVIKDNVFEDFIWDEVNDAFEKLTGLRNVKGKRATESVPAIRESSPELFDILYRVASTGKQEKVEIFLESLNAWLDMSIYSSEESYVTIVFDNISERKRIEHEIQRTLNELEGRVRERTAELEEINTTLRVLLKKREEDQKNIEKNVQSNVDELVIPFITKLKRTTRDENALSCIKVIEENLSHIVSPFISRLSEIHKKLTPREIEIAALIKLGRTSKEIADLLGLSSCTIEVHRNNIRKKLNLKAQNANLRSCLLFKQ